LGKRIIINFYSTASVSELGVGLFRGNSGEVNNIYWDIETSGRENSADRAGAM